MIQNLIIVSSVIVAATTLTFGILLLRHADRVGRRLRHDLWHQGFEAEAMALLDPPGLTWFGRSLIALSAASPLMAIFAILAYTR